MINFKSLFNLALNKGLFHLLGSNFLVQFLGFGLVLFLANYLTQSEVGNLKLIHSYTAFFILVGCFGFNSAILKVCSENIDDVEKKACFNYAFKRVVTLSIFSFMGMMLFNYFYFIPSRSEGDTWPYLYSIVIVFAPPSFLVMAYMQSQKKVKLAAKLQAVVRVFFVFFIFISAVIYGFKGVIVSTVISYVIGFFVYIPYVKNELSYKYKYKKHKKIDSYSFYIFIGAVITVVLQNVDIYTLAYFDVESSRIGVYSVATLFFLSGAVITGTIQTIITPYFSEKQSDLLWVKNKAIYYQKRLIILSIPISLGLMLFSFLLVEFYFGDENSEAVPLSFILILKYLIWSSFCVYGAVLFSIGVVKEGIYIAVLMLFFNVISSFLLFPLFNVYGIAMSQVISAIIQLVLVNYLFKYKTNIT